MKKTIIILTASLLITGAFFALTAQSSDKTNEDAKQLAQWEELAQQGDTAAMHRLIEFYDENSTEPLVIEAAYDAYGNKLDVDEINAANHRSAEETKIYTERLNYWLDKGIAMNDPVALATKGMRLYYGDEAGAIAYLSKAADEGNAQAALFCGSACMNQGRGDEAFKYLSMAYELGAPSAGWHLSMCYSSGVGTEPDREKAIEVMRHAAMMNYPEAVLEMRRIEPGNKIWQHKADSLEIDFPDFEIVTDSADAD